MGRVIYRAGWPATGKAPYLPRSPRRGRWWVWIGPYVIGNTASWDRSEQ